MNPTVAVVDHGLGNLYSVQRACAHAGLQAEITADPRVVLRADGIVLPGVGAYGDAMATLVRRGLAEAMREAVAGGTPLLGICLGIQLLMRESEEFGRHEGLGLLDGTVVKLSSVGEGGRPLKIPAVGWNRIHRPEGVSWEATPLEGLADGAFMYFVHSYCVQPSDPSVILSTTRYGRRTYCSGVRQGSVSAFQFHPERSGPEGLRVYGTWGGFVRRRREIRGTT